MSLHPALAARYWRLPALTIGLFLVLIAALVWLTREYDLEEQRTNLVSDVLWMEQNLRFHMERNEDQLTQLAEELLTTGKPSPQADARLRQLLNPENALVRVLWLDAAGEPAGAYPPSGNGAEATGKTPSREVFRLAAGTGRPVYGAVYPVPDGKAQFEVHVPYYGEGGLRGAVVGVYALEELLSREIPWWFSERYRVSAVYGDGEEIAAKSKVAPVSPNLEYEVPFEPPGHGVSRPATG